MEKYCGGVACLSVLIWLFFGVCHRYEKGFVDQEEILVIDWGLDVLAGAIDIIITIKQRNINFRLAINKQVLLIISNKTFLPVRNR